MVQADSGAIGGSTSAEFQVLVDSGEDAIVACNVCDYAANVEIAVPGLSSTPPAEGVSSGDSPARVHTPGVGAIDGVAAFLQVDKRSMLKSLLYAAGSDIVMAVVRGDHEVNELRLARALGVDQVFLAGEADVVKVTGAKVGFAGPVGFKGRILVDRAASLVSSGVTGANESDWHLTNVRFDRDYRGEIADLRLAATGDPCPNCEAGKLTSYRGIEAGHIFILGTKYSATMAATFIDEKQTQRPLVMGCYGIGVSRLVATTIEQHHDENGIRWPMSIAPYQVHLVTLGKEESVLGAARSLYDALEAAGVEVLWDDRDERPGVKFKDADLIGIPLRVTLGAKGLAAGNVELKARTEADPKKVELVPIDKAAGHLVERVRLALRA
jgi:prolyl-tRNA synthetase